jgi:hypothetical protein
MVYPGRNSGEEFVYPKKEAMELAKVTNTPVLFSAVDIPLEVTEPIQSADAPVVTELKRALITAIKPNATSGTSGGNGGAGGLSLQRPRTHWRKARCLCRLRKVSWRQLVFWDYLRWVERSSSPSL